jgi:uncharacterized membrane protein YphA (DoxX/SURF4 family)
MIGAWGASMLVAGLLVSAPAEAHEKWFTDSSKFPITWGEAFSLKTLLVIVAVAAGLGVAYGLDWYLKTLRPNILPRTVRLSERQLERIFAWVPLLLGLHAAVPLLVSGLQLRLFAANLQLPRNFFGGVMCLLQITVALSFVYGALTRVFAVVLLALFPLGFLFFSPPYVLEHLDLAGIAVFLFITGRGPFSVDALIGSPARPLARYLKYAVPSLRILTGCAIVVLGFTEKIWNEQLAQSFLAYQDFNFARPLGFSNEAFILAAGIVEILVGAVLISGKLTRLVIAVAWIPFNLTLPFLGWVELSGHFPVYGTMVVLLLWGAGQDLRPYLRTLQRGNNGVEVGEPMSARSQPIPSGG